jgi:pyroglutamyl-peptidase
MKKEPLQLNISKNIDGRNSKISRIIPSGWISVKEIFILTLPIIVILLLFIGRITSNNVKNTELITIPGAETEATVVTEKIILLTGFEPFGGHTVNSSWEIVKKLDGLQVSKDVRVISIQIPVLWESASEVLKQNIDRHHPIIVINVGQGSDQMSLERFAHNRSGNTPDNANKILLTDTILDGGPLLYETRFNLESLQEQLSKFGIVSIISDDAGDYLCNYLSYYSYYYLSKKYTEIPTMFVHVPPIHDLNNPSDSEKLRQLITAMKILIIQDYYQYSSWNK